MSPQTPDPAQPDARTDGSSSRSILTRLGGSLGISGCCVGMGIFFLACAGFDGAFKLSFAPVILGGTGLLISMVGGIIEMNRMAEDTHVLAAVFVCGLGLLGGVLEMAVWLGWQTFSK